MNFYRIKISRQEVESLKQQLKRSEERINTLVSALKSVAKDDDDCAGQCNRRCQQCEGNKAVANMAIKLACCE